MNVLSLFDGISCARIALDQLGIKVDNYFSSEIDKFAIDVSRNNYKDIIQIGDIKNIDVKKLPKIDLLIGGSPCQDLSGAKKGLGLMGSKSRLFYEYVRIYKELNPKYFLLENVRNKWGDLMDEIIGIKHTEINSSLFSAQSRPRFYWTNIRFEKIPKIKNKESIEKVIEKNVEKKYFIEKNGLENFIKNTNYEINNKSNDEIIKIFDIPRKILNDNERQRRVYSIKGKSPTILARSDTTKILIENKVRKLTPLECERLQKIPDNYTSGFSDTQRYKMIGNAFTVEVIKHILKNLKK